MFRNCIKKSSSLIKQSSNISYQTKINNFRENRSYGKEMRIVSIKKFYDSTRVNQPNIPSNPDENIDSHDNSMYHKSLTDKNSKVHPHINNHDYSTKALVEDFNKRWKKNLTLEEYYKYFK